MRLLAFTLVLVAWVSTAASAVITVYPDGSGDVPTIAEALQIAVSGDTISLGDGVFFEHDLALKSGVSIISQSGDPAFTTIDAEMSGRCLNGPSVTGAPPITGITLQNGVHAEEGGLLLAGHNNVRFNDCLFRNGSSMRGGAVALTGPSQGHSPKFTRCRFESNEATSDGGAIWSNGIGWAEDCEFFDNTAEGNGGAVYCEKVAGWGMWFKTCRFELNVAGGDGGAVYSTGSGDYLGTWITGGVLISNAAQRGGAARLEDFDFAGSSHFIENEATDAGGALYLLDIQLDKEFDWFAGNLLARNRAGTRGGAIAVTGLSFLYLYNSTLFGNHAPAGAHLWSDTAGMWGELDRTILSFGLGGSATEGSGPLVASCNDVHGNPGGDYVGPLDGQGSINGNISEDPLFCDPADDDYTLQEGSPCYTPLPEGCGVGAIGAFGIGCSGPSSVPEPPTDGDVRERTWGSIKADYR